MKSVLPIAILNEFIYYTQNIAWFDDHTHSTGALTTRLAVDASEVKGVCFVYSSALLINTIV